MFNACLTEINKQVPLVQKKISQGEAFQLSMNDQVESCDIIISLLVSRAAAAADAPQFSQFPIYSQCLTAIYRCLPVIQREGNRREAPLATSKRSISPH
jgi:hypothetical protein